MNNFYRHHVFFCLNVREDGAPCCTNKGSQTAFEHMKARVKMLNLRGAGQVRVNQAGCFDRCTQGPLLVIYPDAVWYTYANTADIDEIITSHLQNNILVERLLVK